MSESNNGLSRPVGQCCAGKHCVDSSLELSQQHKCITCNEVVHMVCGEPTSDDSVTCFSCVRGATIPNDEPQEQERVLELEEEAAHPEASTDRKSVV